MQRTKDRIKDVQCEAAVIAGFLRHIKTFEETPLNQSSFVSKFYGTCYGVIKDLIDSGKDVNPLSIASQIAALGMSFEELPETSIKDHLDEIKMNLCLSDKGAIDQAKKLLKIQFCRERALAIEGAYKYFADAKTWEEPIDNILKFSEGLVEGDISMFQRSGEKEFVDIFDGIEQEMEERAANPIKEFGYYSPFPRYNYLYDAFFTPSDVNLIAARSNTGKSACGFFVCMHVAEKYGIPILHMDRGEMPQQQTQARIVCSLSKGIISTYHYKTGLWKQHPEMVKIYNQIKPQINRLKGLIHYKGIGGLSSQEICSVIRRFWLTHIGRFSKFPTFGSKLGSAFPVNYDYLKTMDSDTNDPQWMVLGNHLQDLKTLITEQVPACIQTYLQLNRSAVNRGKGKGQYEDSENAFSLSDLVYQQVSRAEILRYKTMDELAEENNKYGNCILKNVKRRDLGEGYKEALKPVRLPDGSWTENHIHLKQESFFWSECGDLAQSVAEQGQVYSDEENNDDSVELR